MAYVDETPILKAQVDRLLARQGTQPTTASAFDRQRALTVLIDQHLASIYLKQRLKGKTNAEIEAALQRWREGLSARNQAELDFLAASGLTLDTVRNEIAWQVNWRLYLEQHLTESSLQKYFDRHRREFDGTELKVRQIQWNFRPKESGARPTAAKSPTVENLVKQAGELRERIVQEELTFSAAAEQFSESPSGADGGQLGWIARDGPMHEDFNRAAYALQPGEISFPVSSPFGVHLILCEEVRPGNRSFQQQREAVRQAVKRFLFRRLADQQRPKSQVTVVTGTQDD